MANTLKFGNGEWATKKGSTLAYNDENGNFKPLPFTFDRAGSATRVNKQGLIEVVSNNEPRIDFLNDSKGALLLEPSRTNLIPSNVSDWVVFQSNVTQSNQSPDGYNNAIKITSNAVVNSGVYLSGLSVSGNTEIFTIWLKGENGGEILEIGDATNRTTVTLTNEWVRYEAKAISASAFKILYNQTTNPIVQTWYAWGPQLEDNVSYATSYIPTQGSVATRVRDSAVQTIPNGIIQENEMTLYTEFEYLGGEDTQLISIHNDFNSVIWILVNSSNQLSGTNFYGNSFYGVVSMSSPITPNTRYKVAYRTKSGDSALYVNGVLQGVSTETIINTNTLRRVELGSFWNGLNTNTNSKIIEAKCYNNALSNSELAALTQV